MGTQQYLSVNVYPQGEYWIVCLLIREPGGKFPRLISDVGRFEYAPAGPSLAAAARAAALVLLAEFPDETEH
jgi:hypothetical protein